MMLPQRSRTITEFNGVGVWRDENGVIWMRLRESIEMQADAWLQGAMVASRRFAGEGVNPADWDQGNPYRNITA